MCFQPRTRVVGLASWVEAHLHGYQVVIDRGLKCGLNQERLLYQSLESPQKIWVSPERIALRAK